MAASALRVYPKSSVFYRTLNQTLPRIVSGKGCWLTDAQGKRYLDACGGAFVANIGHGVKEIGEAIAQQAGRIAYVNGTAFTNDAVEDLAAEVSTLMPKGLNKSYFLSSGSEAVEAALKLARQYWLESGKPKKHKIIARNPGYHGNTLLALSASAREHYKVLYGPWLVPVAMIPAPYPYRCECQSPHPTTAAKNFLMPPSTARLRRACTPLPKGRGQSETDCPACSGSALEQAILKEGAENVAAFIAEPVGGSSTGASAPRPDYYRRIREICDRHQVLFIADEVLCGAGRTGRWLAMEHYDILPDIVTMGKGISGGYLPLSAVITSEKILDVIAKGSGGFKHAQTFSHTPTICAAGAAAIRHIKKNKLIERSAKMGKVLQQRLSTLKELPGVGDVRGIGMLAGVEFVADKKSKKPFERKLKAAETFANCAREEGLVVWPNYGQLQDGQGDLALIAPPFIITDSEIDQLVTLFAKAWEKTYSSLTLPLSQRERALRRK